MLPHEALATAQVRRRYPAFKMDDDWVALWERDAGFSDRSCVSNSSLDKP